MEELGELLEIDECLELLKKKVVCKKVIVYFMLSLFLDCYVKLNLNRCVLLWEECEFIGDWSKNLICLCVKWL